MLSPQSRIIGRVHAAAFIEALARCDHRRGARERHRADLDGAGRGPRHVRAGRALAGHPRRRRAWRRPTSSATPSSRPTGGVTSARRPSPARIAELIATGSGEPDDVELLRGLVYVLGMRGRYDLLRRVLDALPGAGRRPARDARDRPRRARLVARPAGHLRPLRAAPGPAGCWAAHGSRARGSLGWGRGDGRGAEPPARTWPTEVINPRFRALADGEIHEKRPGDLVTDADREAEVLITAALTAAYPEPSCSARRPSPATRRCMERYAAADHAFTVDPVDGTKNFVHGSKDHAVMVERDPSPARPCGRGSGSRSTSSATSPSVAPAPTGTTPTGPTASTVPEPAEPAACAAAPHAGRGSASRSTASSR